MKPSPEHVRYLQTLQLYFEEEIMGEAYFHGLFQYYQSPCEQKKLTLLARVERHAAEVVRPLLQSHNLNPRSDQTLVPLGKAWSQQHHEPEWIDLIKDMVIRYPGYVEQFEALEELAPAADVPALKVLTDHEVAVIKFANMELSGNPDSTKPLCQYLSTAV